MRLPSRSSVVNLFEAPDASGRILAMEGGRGIAILLVFLVHYSNHFHPWLRPGSFLDGCRRAVEVVGQAGVDLFFVLSGYLLYGLLVSRPVPYRVFLRRRYRRIYPAFLASWLTWLKISSCCRACSTSSR
jgi:exopolysaccharide production protein ExoZ